MSRRTAGVVFASLVLVLALVEVASAALASTGAAVFYPCTRCHPVFVDAAGKPTKPLPNGMKKHEIDLEAHDVLGEGDKACLACHDDPKRNPGKLRLPDGTFVDIEGDVSRVCRTCHFGKYQDFSAGVHGKGLDKCTTAGCHNPHRPSWIYVAALPPFQGTGFEVKAVGPDREPFKPFAAPPVAPPVETPVWLWVVTGLGSVATLGLVGFMMAGRTRR